MDNVYGLDELHAQLLRIMVYLDSFCRERGIQYSLAAGTLLGAVRHKGFIPWDDDMDIMLDRENYDKLVMALDKEIDADYIVVQDIWVKRLCLASNLEDERVCVDLFVYDNVPNKRINAKLKVLIIKTLQGMMKINVDYSRYSFKYRILLFVTGLMGRFFSQKKKMKMYDNVSQWGNKRKTDKKTVYNALFAHVSKYEYKSEIMDSYIDLEFDGHYFMAIEDYDYYLKIQYGDYMVLPPEEKRVPSHH